jgi:hypothetical protein
MFYDRTRKSIFLIEVGYIRLADASDKAYQLLAHGQWFSPGTSASSTTKTGCHDIAEIFGFYWSSTFRGEDF